MPPSPTDIGTLDGVRSVAHAQLADRSVPTATDRSLRWLYVAGGLTGLTAAFILLIEKLAILEDPSYVPSCSINPVLNCGSIMRTDQSAVFGFPNPVLGIVGFTIIVTVGLTMFARATFRPWFWNGLLIGCLAGLVLIHWLIFQSLYRIGALCPYCMAVWAVTIPIAWYTALRIARLRTTDLGVRPVRPVQFALDHHGVILTIWYLTIVGLILRRFWDYWQTLLP